MSLVHVQTHTFGATITVRLRRLLSFVPPREPSSLKAVTVMMRLADD